MTSLIKTAVRVLSVALLTLPLLGGPTCAKAFKVGDIAVDHPWARATPGRAKNGAAYMKLRNHGGTDDRLMTVSSDVASRVELHTHLHDNGVMKMTESGPILVPAHGEAILQPGSLHVMMIGLTAPLMEGAAPVATASRQSSSTKPQSRAKESEIIVSAAIFARRGITPCSCQARTPLPKRG